MKSLHLLLLAVAIVVALAFLTFAPSRMRSWQSRFFDVSSPAIQAGAVINDRITKMNKGFKTLDELEAENAALLRQNNELRASAQLLNDLAAENRRLRDTLGYLERSPFNLVPAKVISRDSTTWWSSVKINQGFAEEVNAAQPVLTADGLVGRTTTVAKNLSMVMLLTDENCQVAARIEETGDQGIMTGLRSAEEATPQIVLNFLKRNADIKPGMKVVTAGVSGGVFPAGIPLGTVKEFRTRELYGQAVIEPAADISCLEDVFVVRGTK